MVKKISNVQQWLSLCGLKNLCLPKVPLYADDQVIIISPPGIQWERLERGTILKKKKKKILQKTAYLALCLQSPATKLCFRFLLKLILYEPSAYLEADQNHMGNTWMWVVLCSARKTFCDITKGLTSRTKIQLLSTRSLKAQDGLL